MALETVFYPQDPFGYGSKDFYSLIGILGEKEAATDLHANTGEYSSSTGDAYTATPEVCTANQAIEVRELSAMKPPALEAPESSTNGWRKRRRSRKSKNKEELENQRMTHIKLERNRRKQMNDYLAELRSLIPPSYVQRGDQASIIGAAINLVKELEQQLQSMEVRMRRTISQQLGNNIGRPLPPPFTEFFRFPQFSTRVTRHQNSPLSVSSGPNKQEESVAADIEVSMMESHANLKILAKKQPKQLLKLVAALQSLRFSVHHLNVTTADPMVLYTISLKVEEGCHLKTIDEIAIAVTQMLHTIQEEAAF